MEFINLKKQYEVIKPVIDSHIAEIMADSRFIGGKEVGEFESKLAEYVGRKHCISCGNGTDALMLSYLAYGIKKGDAVFCPDMTFIASIEPACMLGATPVFVDIDKTSYNIDTQKLEAAIEAVKSKGVLTPKAVVAVDFLGNPADLEVISDICKRHNLIMIEDAAQGIGAMYKGKKCGSFGDVACTSFFPSKPLGCYGDGGAVFTDDDDIASIIRSYKVHGKGTSKYDNVRIGVNSRLDTIQAAVLLAKIVLLEDEIQKRQLIAAKYDAMLKDVLQVPVIEKNSRSSYAQYVCIAKNTIERDKIVAGLKEAGIPSLIYYPKALHTLDAFNLKVTEGFDVAQRYAECNFGIPFSPYLTSEEQDIVVSTIRNILK